MSADQVLELVGEIYGTLDLATFRRRLLSALRRVVPCDWASLNDIGPQPEDLHVIVEPPMSESQVALFARLAHENPLIARYARTGDGRAYRFSDVTDTDSFHRTELYRLFYGALGAEHQIAFTLPAPRGRLLGVALSRRERDFTDAERELLDRARPFLIQGYRAALEHSGAASQVPPAATAELRARGLTDRECQILEEFLAARSATAVAELFGLSPRTVHKHLQRAYRKLGVSGRAGALALVRQGSS